MAKFYVETRSDGIPWTREKCNARADGDWMPWPDRPAAEAAVRELRSSRQEPPTIYLLEQCSDKTNRTIKY